MRDDRAGTLPGTKIIPLKSLIRKVIALKRLNKKIVFTNGCFDILHLGHVKYLQDAKAKGDYLIVAVNSDKSIKKIKGNKRPIIGQNDRLRTIAALSSVDFTILFNEENPLKLITALKPDILIKGADWKKENIAGSGFVESYGGKVTTINLVKGRSTSAIIEKIVKNFAKKQYA